MEKWHTKYVQLKDTDPSSDLEAYYNRVLNMLHSLPGSRRGKYRECLVNVTDGKKTEEE